MQIESESGWTVSLETHGDAAGREEKPRKYSMNFGNPANAG